MSRALVMGVALGVAASCGGKSSQRVPIEGPLDAGSDGTSSAGGGGSAGTTSDAGSPTERAIVHPCSSDALGVAGASSNFCSGTAVAIDWTGPTGVVLLVDRSATMADRLPGASGSKWDAVRQGVAQYLQTRPLGFHQLALQFFESPTAAADTCNPSDYAAPAIPFDPDGITAGQIQSVVNAFATTAPDAPLRPTAAALAGAVSYTSQWISASPATQLRGGILVLITDGDDTACGVTVDDLRALVAAAPMSTCVIQLGTGFDLGPITESELIPGAFRIASGEASGPIADALFDCIYGVGSPASICDPQLPSSPSDQTFDYARTVVTLDGRLVPMLPSAAACDASNAGGWYYDDPARPTRVNLCPCSCATQQASSDMTVSMSCNP